MCEMTHIFQAVGGFICGGNFGPRGPVYTAPGGNIYLCGVQRVEKGPCSASKAGGSSWVCTCAFAYNSGLPRPKKKRGAEEEEGTRRSFCTREFREHVPHKSTGSGITVLSANPGAARHPPVRSSALSVSLRFPMWENGRNKKTNPTEVRELSARIHASTCPTPDTQYLFNKCLMLPFIIIITMITPGYRLQ